MSASLHLLMSVYVRPGRRPADGGASPVRTALAELVGGVPERDLPPGYAIMTAPNAGLPDLVRRLTQDSKRLVTDEVRLAKIEVRESMSRASRGVLWLALAFGVGVVTLVALTLFLVTLIGRAANGHMWVGAFVVGVAELALGGYLVKHGLSTFLEPSWSLEESRNALADTAHWASAVRRA